MEDNPGLHDHDSQLLLLWRRSVHGTAPTTAEGNMSRAPALCLLSARVRLIARNLRIGIATHAILRVRRSRATKRALHNAGADVLDDERDEDSCSDDGRRSPLVAHRPRDALRCEHELGVRVQVHECRGDHDARAKVLEEQEDQARDAVVQEGGG